MLTFKSIVNDHCVLLSFLTNSCREKQNAYIVFDTEWMLEYIGLINLLYGVIKPIYVCGQSVSILKVIIYSLVTEANKCYGELESADCEMQVPKFVENLREVISLMCPKKRGKRPQYSFFYFICNLFLLLLFSLIHLSIS